MTTPIKKLMLAMAAAFALCLGARAANEGKTWMVVDLRTGALSYYGYDLATATNTFNTPLYKTEKMVFRRIPQGWYWIQNGEQHAFMQNDYYIAIFPCTVGQYAIILDKTAAVDPTDEENLKPKGSIAWFDWEGEWYIDWETRELPIKTGDPVSPTLWGIDYTSENAMYAFEELILGHDESLRGKYVVDMPTSSMWEVAARAIAAGDDTHKTWPWFFGETADDFDLYAWCSKAKTVNDEPFPVMPVGLLRPNAWGLFDVYGNVGEWTSDGIGVPYGVPSPYDDYHDEEVTVEVANSYPIRFSQWPCHDVRNKEMDHYRMNRLCCGGSSDFSDGHDYVDRINSSYRRIEEKDIRYHYIGTRIAIVCKGEGAAAPVTITWKDYQGNTVKTDTNVTFGQVPEYDGPTPTKPSTVVSNYTFAGWTPTPTYAVSNTTYTARFAESLNSYDIHWLNYDGTGIYTGKGWYGEIPVFYASTPVRPSTAQYDYEFTGWYPEPVAATCEASYTAQFRPCLREYYVSWENYNGTELKYTWVYYGTMPEAVYDLAAPTRPDDEQYAYTFAGWTPSEPVTSNTTYTAVYTPGPRAAYDIAWLNYDGSTNATTRTPYNTIPEFEGETPAKPSTVQYAYTFAGWAPELEPATSNAAYTAVFDESIREYPVNFYNNTGSELLFTTNVPYGSTPEYLGETPTKPSTAQYHYSFAGWGRDMRVVDGPSFYNDYYAEFDPVLRSYEITWANYDGTVLCVTNVPYGTTPAYTGATPTKPQTVTSQFAFSGWTETVVSVTGAATYTAAYAETPRPYPVTWLNYDGTVLCVTNIPYGEIPAYLGATPKKASAYRCHYEFSGWTPELAAVTEAGATYTATFNEVIDLLAHLTFDDYGNDGLNVLKATFGEDGIVRTTRANVVEGLGAVTPVTDAAILAGLPEGDGAVAIPCRSHIALPIPAALASASGKPWSISMKVKFPSFGRYYSVFTMPAANNSDMMVFLTNSSDPSIVLKQSDRVGGNGGFTAGQWETLLFLFDSGRTRVLLNGKQIFSYAYTLAGSRADCANAGGYILLAGDEDGEDAFMYWADVRVYDGIVDDTRGLVTHTVTWVNNDGTILKTEDVAEGCMPENDALLSKPSDDPNKYDRFTGWTPSLAPVTSNVTYTATFEATDYRIVNLSELTGDYTVQDGDMLTGTAPVNIKLFVSDGATVTLDNATHNYDAHLGNAGGIDCKGDAVVILLGDNTMSGVTGIYVPPGKTMTIRGLGTLTASGTTGIGAWGYNSCGNIVIEGGTIVALGSAAGIGCAYYGHCGNITITGGDITATASQNKTDDYAAIGTGNDARYGHCGDITIGLGITKVVATKSPKASNCIGIGTGGSYGVVTIAEDLQQTYSNDGRTLTIVPDVKETAVTVGGVAVGEVVRGEDGKTLSFAVAAGTDAGDVKLDIGGVDVTKGFRVTVNGTEARAVLLAPYEVPKEAGAADGIWTENGDGTVTLNVEVVPGLYYAADSAESIDALACPGASAPATGATTLTAPKPVGDKGFFKVWVSDAPIPATP